MFFDLIGYKIRVADFKFVLKQKFVLTTLENLLYNRSIKCNFI